MTMSMATGAMGSLLPKLVELLKEEYKLKESVKERVRSLEKEMKSMQAALRKVGEVPRDQLDEQVMIWAGEVRELSFNMEDVVDKFMVRADDSSKSPANSNKLKRLTKKMASLFTKGKARHEIADAIKDINKKAQDVANNRVRYNVDNIVARPAAVTPDPRLRALYTEVTELVGIAGKRDQDLMRLLLEGDSMSKKKLKIVSVVGFGGLGKTTLVKMVYETIKGDFDCSAFVPVGRNADAKKVFMDLLLDLGMDKNQFTLLDERQLIDKLRENLQNKRYLIVIDDIWDENLWRVVKCAFSNSNDLGSRLVTTTRMVSVSKSCSSSFNDSIYQMEPLSDDDSKSLFYKRIFSHESRCPPEFKEVSIDILKKCGGVPLAIITIASLLASDQRVKPEDEWHVLLDSIGRGLTEDPSAEEMLRILSFSYYDLPSHLKTCLLYLSMFPEDHRIMKDQLIWMWIAESFVQCEKAKTSLFEIGETYFNELVNRSLIQPLYNHYGIVYGCRVHDSVLDLICSLSSKENFITVLNGIEDIMSSQSNVRRLSLQNGRKEEKQQTTSLKSMSILQVRSIAAFDSALMLPFPSFSVLRVLDMGGCNISGYKHLNLRDLGTLFNLRYLGLARTGISQVPEEIGKLQFLQVLDLSGNKGITELPPAVIRLRRLMCLLIGNKGVKFSGQGSRLPDGIGNLTSMEVLGDVHVDSLSKVKELGNLERLRDLGIEFAGMSLELEDAFVESLGKMSNMESVEVTTNGGDYLSMDLLMERWVPPRSLCRFIADQAIQFSKVPAWIRRNPSHMSHLFLLEIFVEEVRQEDMGFLGKLPALRSLVLLSSSQTSLLLGADGFRCLTSFHLYSESAGGIMFQPGALPKAEQVVFQVSLQATKEEAAETGGDWFDLGIGNLPSLRMVDVHLHVSGVTVWEARRVEAALRAHRTSGSIRSEFNPDIREDAHDDEVCK